MGSPPPPASAGGSSLIAAPLGSPPPPAKAGGISASGVVPSSRLCGGVFRGLLLVEVALERGLCGIGERLKAGVFFVPAVSPASSTSRVSPPASRGAGLATASDDDDAHEILLPPAGCRPQLLGGLGSRLLVTTRKANHQCLWVLGSWPQLPSG